MSMHLDLPSGTEDPRDRYRRPGGMALNRIGVEDVLNRIALLIEPLLRLLWPASGPSVAVAGVFRARGQVDVHGHRCVAIHSQSETGRARLARGSEVTTHLSHGS